MAKKNNNEDPEDEKDDQFDDDEDFGLPDLEYEELDEDEGEDSDVDEPATEEVEEAPSAEKDDEEEIDLPEEESLEAGNADETDTEDWEKELEKELEEELKSGEPAGYYEEESYEEFESSNTGDVAEPATPAPASTPSPRPAAGAAYAADTYTTRPGKVPPQRYASYDDGEGSKGKFARTVIIGTLAFALIAIVFFWLYDGEPGQEPVADKVERKVPPPKKEEPKPVVKEPVEQAPAKTPQANAVTPGQITTLDQQTGKTYVIVGSFFDGDQAGDFAQKLARDGKSPMIIPPFKDYRFYRVSIAEFNSFKDAQTNIENYKSEFGADVWPLRY